VKHPSEEQLVLFHYGEAEGRAAIESHLASCAECRAVYLELENALAAVSALRVPERPGEYEGQVWRRLEPQLGPAAGPRWDWIFAPRRWAFAGALATLLVAAFVAGRFWPRPQLTSSAAIPKPVRERILLVAVGEHLERSQMVLIELENADGKGEVDISSEQKMARELVASNRLYRQAAQRSGDVAMASVLDDLERVLVEVAHSPSQMSPAQMDEIRRRIEAKGILFKIRVIGSDVEQQEKSAATAPSAGRT
jgi:hypothetical protein